MYMCYRRFVAVVLVVWSVQTVVLTSAAAARVVLTVANVTRQRSRASCCTNTPVLLLMACITLYQSMVPLIVPFDAVSKYYSKSALLCYMLTRQCCCMAIELAVARELSICWQC
jgi:hypothetical protein